MVRLDLVGTWDGLEGPSGLQSHFRHLVLHHVAALSCWLAWASSQHGGLRKVRFLKESKVEAIDVLSSGLEVT